MKNHTDGFRDLYRIMQVDYLAEPEVIEGAYKRLSKKYHPDTNKDPHAETKMKQINQAYATLSDTGKRREYDLLYQQRLNQRDPASPRDQVKPEQLLSVQAAEVLQKYFASLASGAFEAAYDLVSQEDQKYISKADFLEWQTTVTGLYEIGDFNCVHFKTFTGKETGNKAFSHVFEFQISLAERERSTGKVNNTEFSRVVVLEKQQLKMYLGYQDIQAIISKFKQLASKRSAPEESGFDRLRLRGEVEREIARANRYARPFSVVLFEALDCPPFEHNSANEQFEASFGTIVRQVTRQLRQTDCCGRWSRNRMMVVLPETRIFAACKTTEKLFKVIKSLGADWEAPELAFSAGIVQYKQASPEEFLDLLVANLLAAKSRGKWQVMY